MYENQRYRRNIPIRNNLEQGIQQELNRLSDCEVKYESESIPYTVQRKYIPDFVVTTNNGRRVYIEVKGYLRREDEEKLLAVKRQNPDIDLRIVFAKDNKLVGRKSRYSDWANKHGFKYSIGEVKGEWFT